LIFRASFIKIEKQEKYRIFPCAQTVFQVNYVKVGYSYPTFFAERINTDRFRLKPSDVGNPKGFVNQAQNLSGVIFFIHNFLLFVVFEKTVYNSIDFFAFFRYNLFGKSTGRIVHL